MASYKLRPLYTRAVPAQRSCAAGRLQRQPLGRPRAEPSTRTCLVYFRHEDVSVSPDPGETLLEVGAEVLPTLHISTAFAALSCFVFSLL